MRRGRLSTLRLRGARDRAHRAVVDDLVSAVGAASDVREPALPADGGETRGLMAARASLG
jgi:hypothetical protein